MIIKCLDEAERLQVNSIAFPAMGTGVLGYPPETVGKVFLETCVEFAGLELDRTVDTIKLVIFPANDTTKTVRI